MAKINVTILVISITLYEINKVKISATNCVPVLKYVEHQTNLITTFIFLIFLIEK